MGRVKIQLPDRTDFSCTLPVRITDINYGSHLGNDAFLGLLHEARLQWLAQYGWTELDLNGTGLIMIDIAIRFKSEASHGHRLQIQFALADWTECGFTIVYLATNLDTGKEFARAQTGMLFFDYTNRKLMGTPAGFREKVCPV